MSKQILLLAFTFPPAPGIGGRRWAKFAKYLSKEGYTVHVICARNNTSETSLFEADVQNDAQIIRHYFSSGYPEVLNTIPATFFQKLKYTFWLRLLPFLTPGYFFDKAIFSEKSVLKMAGDLLTKHQIETVIATGAPFRMNYYATRLKVLFPHIRLINDFRDPWMWAGSYSYDRMRPSRKAFEKQMRDTVLEWSDHITVPVEAMKDFLINNYPKQANKIKLLPHAFDESEICEKTDHSIKNTIRLVFYGTLYPGLENYVSALAKVLGEHKGRIQLDLYTNVIRYKDIFAAHGACNFIAFKEPMQGKELFKKLSGYDHVLIIQPDYAKDYISTKFYEIIRCRIPIIMLGQEGVTSGFLQKSQTGVFFPVDEIVSGVNDLAHGKIKHPYNAEYEVLPFSFSAVTRSLAALF